MKNKKFSISNISKVYDNKLVHRIIANETFGDVYEGSLGGYVEHEYNLSQDGNCWIYDNAVVADNATISENATIHDNVIVTEDASIYGSAKLYNDVIITGKAKIFENARLYDNTYVTSEASIYGSAKISGRSCVSGNAKIYGHVDIEGFTRINENATIFGYNMGINGISKISGNAIIFGNNIRYMFGEYKIFDNAYISSLDHVFYISDDIKSIDYNDYSITCYKTKNGYGIYYNDNYFNDINEFKDILLKNISNKNRKVIMSKNEVDALIRYMKYKIKRKFYNNIPQKDIPKELK